MHNEILCLISADPNELVIDKGRVKLTINDVIKLKRDAKKTVAAVDSHFNREDTDYRRKARK